MTRKGEQSTVKGKFKETTFPYCQDLSVWYSKDFSTSELDKLIMQIDQNSDTPVFQMIFAVKGNFICFSPDTNINYALLENQQHNLMLFHSEKVTLKYLVNEENELIIINLSSSFLLRYLPIDHPGYKNLVNGINKSKPIFFSKQNMHITPEINAVLNSLQNSTHTGFCGKLFLESKVIELLALQFSQFALLQQNTNQSPVKREDLDKMQKVRQIVINNFNKQLSLRTLAHMVGTNEFNLKKQFKTVYGTTVYGYLNQHKMEQAKEILIHGDAKISEVSIKMGYKHATHFTSAFKRYFGYLPTKIKLLMLLSDPELSFLLFYT